MRPATLEDARKAYIENTPITYTACDTFGFLAKECDTLAFTGVVYRYTLSDSDETIIDDLRTFRLDTMQMKEYLFSLEIQCEGRYDKVYICKNGVLSQDWPDVIYMCI